MEHVYLSGEHSTASDDNAHYRVICRHALFLENCKNRLLHACRYAWSKVDLGFGKGGFDNNVRSKHT